MTMFTVPNFLCFCRHGMMYLGMLLLLLLILRRFTDNEWVAKVATSVGVLIGVLAVSQYAMSDSISLSLGGYGQGIMNAIIIAFLIATYLQVRRNEEQTAQLREEVAAMTPPPPPGP